MKKFLSLFMALLMLAVPMLGTAEDAESAFDMLWAQYDLSFLEKLGVLTQEEVSLLTREKEAVAAGRELVRTLQLGAEGYTGDPAADAAIAELLDALCVTVSVRQSEAAAVVSLSGQDVLSGAIGEKDGMLHLASGVLEQPVSLSLDEVDALLRRIVNAAQAAGYIDDEQAMQLGYQLALYPASRMVSQIPMSYLIADKLLRGEIGQMELDLTAWHEVLDPIQARMNVSAVAEQPGDCDEAAEMWTVEVTGAELDSFIVAALKVVRDNHELCDMLDEMLGFEGTLPQYIERYILSAESMTLFGEEALLLDLTGWTDAAGDLARLEVMVLDTDVDEAALQEEMEAAAGADDEALADYFANVGEMNKLMMTITHTRNTVDGTAYYLTTMLDDEAWGISYSLTEGPGVWSIAMAIMEQGSVGTEVTLAASWQQTRENGEMRLNADVQLSTYSAGYGEDAEPTTYQPMTAVLDVQMSANAYRIEASMAVLDMLEEGEKMTLSCVSDYTVDGMDIAGTDTAIAAIGDKRVTAAAQTRTQEPQTSLLEEAALHLNSLTDAEMTAWLTGVVGRGQECIAQLMELLPQGIRDALESYGE